jgi:purine-nucleoside phosphorylase
MLEKLKSAKSYLEKAVKDAGHKMPELAVTLGSGLGEFANRADKLMVFPYTDIPYFPQSTVVGHAGRLILAKDKLTGENFWIMQGRVHFYEGYTMEEVVFPIRLFILCGIKRYVVTNAAGGVNYNFSAGDFMIIKDHINMMGTNPLIGPNYEDFGTRFPAMSEAYNKDMIATLRRVSIEKKVEMKEGVYMALTGPTFETPSEVRMVRLLGADAVGMSTVPEVIAANHAGVKVAGITFVSNAAADLATEPPTHEEVSENAQKVEKQFTELMEGFIGALLEEK